MHHGFVHRPRRLACLAALSLGLILALSSCGWVPDPRAPEGRGGRAVQDRLRRSRAFCARRPDREARPAGGLPQPRVLRQFLGDGVQHRSARWSPPRPSAPTTAAAIVATPPATGTRRLLVNGQRVAASEADFYYDTIGQAGPHPRVPGRPQDARGRPHGHVAPGRRHRLLGLRQRRLDLEGREPAAVPERRRRSHAARHLPRLLEREEPRLTPTTRATWRTPTRMTTTSTAARRATRCPSPGSPCATSGTTTPTRRR